MGQKVLIFEKKLKRENEKSLVRKLANVASRG